MYLIVKILFCFTAQSHAKLRNETEVFSNMSELFLKDGKSVFDIANHKLNVAPNLRQFLIFYYLLFWKKSFGKLFVFNIDHISLKLFFCRHIYLIKQQNDIPTVEAALKIWKILSKMSNIGPSSRTEMWNETNNSFKITEYCHFEIWTKTQNWQFEPEPV
jgi:hypothetical protein